MGGDGTVNKTHAFGVRESSVPHCDPSTNVWMLWIKASTKWVNVSALVSLTVQLLDCPTSNQLYSLNSWAFASEEKVSSFLSLPCVSSEGDSCEFGSQKYFIMCGFGGILSCGTTHTAVVPLDLVKCRMQVCFLGTVSCFCNVPPHPLITNCPLKMHYFAWEKWHRPSCEVVCLFFLCMDRYDSVLEW